MLTLLGTSKTRAVRPIWLLEELGLEYTQEMEFPRSDRVNEVNPLGTVPVLITEDVVITDSIAMLYYLSDREGRFTFPAGSGNRATLDSRINFLITDLEAPLWAMAKHSFVLPEEDRRPEVKQPMRDEFHRAETRFETLLADGPFLMGEDFTIADIVAGHIARWAVNAKVSLENEAFATYFNNLQTRPAWIRAQEK